MDVPILLFKIQNGLEQRGVGILSTDNKKGELVVVLWKCKYRIKVERLGRG